MKKNFFLGYHNRQRESWLLSFLLQAKENQTQLKS